MVLSSTSLRAETVIYSDDFSGDSATALNGTAPDIRPGSETWLAGASYKADGSVVGADNNNVFLPFTPMSGKIYILSLDVNVTAGGDAWFAFGFTAGNNTTANFANFPINAAPWLLERQDATSTDQTYALTGANISGYVFYNQPPGPKTLKVVLDTRRAQWRAAWYIGNVLLRGAVTYDTNPTITYVGIGKYVNAAGMVDNFKLVDATPPNKVIYSHNFSGDAATELNNQMLEAPATVAWSSDRWMADGSIVGEYLTFRNAFIPFVPESGKIYTLSLDVNVTAGNEDWFALGFTAGNNTTIDFYSGNINAAPWVLERDQGSDRTIPFLGPALNDSSAYNTADGLKNLKIVLSTIGSQWKATWYVNDVVLRPTKTYTTNPTINYIGIGQCLSAAGTIDNLKLEDTTPPPGTLISVH
jgi:hypothetical protein